MRRYEIVENAGTRNEKVVYTYDYDTEIAFEDFKAARFTQREVPIVVVETPPEPRGGVRVTLTQRELAALLTAAELIDRVLKDAVIVDLDKS